MHDYDRFQVVGQLATHSRVSLVDCAVLPRVPDHRATHLTEDMHLHCIAVAVKCDQSTASCWVPNGFIHSMHDFDRFKVVGSINIKQDETIKLPVHSDTAVEHEMDCHTVTPFHSWGILCT